MMIKIMKITDNDSANDNEINKINNNSVRN